MIREILEDAAALVAVALFVATLMLWAGLIGGSL